MPVSMKVILHDLLVLAELSFDFIDHEIDRAPEIIGFGMAEKVHVVSGEMTVSSSQLALHTEGPIHGNSSSEIDLQFLALFLSISSDCFAGAHLFEANCEIHRNLHW